MVFFVNKQLNKRGVGRLKEKNMRFLHTNTKVTKN